jgi:hypothetical protein
MEAIAYPRADKDQPLGWDKIEDGWLMKNGLTDCGGMFQIVKFLPGSISADEINIAFATNIKAQPGRHRRFPHDAGDDRR